MLKHRIIPVLLFDGNLQCVKPISFGRPYRKLGPIEQYVRVLERRQVDEVILLDIEATKEGRKPRAEVIRKLTSSLFCPITYGGGISSLDDIKNCLASGADKVAMDTGCLGSPKLTQEASEKFGAQAIVGCINSKTLDCIDWVCPYGKLTEGGGFSIHEYAKELEMLGVGEILLTDVMSDGAQNGPNCDIIRVCNNAVGIPIVYCGGIRGGADSLEAIKAGASAVAIGSTFLYTETTPKDISEYLDKNGVAVRV